MTDFSKVGKVLSAKGRRQVKESNFALSGRRYPIHDSNHARNALSRVSQHGTPEEKERVRAAVRRKHSGIGKEVLASMRDEFDKIAASKIAADYTNKVVSNSAGSSDVNKSVRGVFSGNSGAPAPQGAGNNLPGVGAGQGSSNPITPQKTTPASKPNKKSTPKNPTGAVKPPVAPGAPKAPGGKSSGSGVLTSGGMPFVPQPLAGALTMGAMPVPPPPLPIMPQRAR